MAATRHPLPYAFARSHQLLLEDDGQQLTLWHSDQPDPGAWGEVLRLHPVRQWQHLDAQSLAQRISAAYAGAGSSAAAVVTEVEGEAANRAIIDAIAAAHGDMVRHYRDGDLIQYYRGNRAIHEGIVNAAGNPVISGLYASVTARIRRARYVTPMTPERWAVAVKEHDAILNALQRRDGVGLAHILRAHLRHKREEVLQAGFAETEGSELAPRFA